MSCLPVRCSHRRHCQPSPEWPVFRRSSVATFQRLVARFPRLYMCGTCAATFADGRSKNLGQFNMSARHSLAPGGTVNFSQIACSSDSTLISNCRNRQALSLDVDHIRDRLQDTGFSREPHSITIRQIDPFRGSTDQRAEEILAPRLDCGRPESACDWQIGHNAERERSEQHRERASVVCGDRQEPTCESSEPHQPACEHAPTLESPHVVEIR